MSARRPSAGHHDLAVVGGDLGERGWAVLTSLGLHHYLTSRQIEGFHFADATTPLAGARACRRLLARLHDQRVLARLERRIGGIRAGSAAHIWTLGPLGDRLLHRDDSTRRRFHEPSPTFLRHGLAIADTHLALVDAQRAGRLDLISVEGEPTCWRRYLGPGGGNETLKPDLYVVTADATYEHCWFIEQDCATESLSAVVRKCRQYDTYWRSGAEQQRTGTFPMVVWIVPTTTRQGAIASALDRTQSLERSLFQVVTPEAFAELVATGAGS